MEFVGGISSHTLKAAAGEWRLIGLILRLATLLRPFLGKVLPNA